MIRDAITERIRAVRHALAAKFGNDVERIGDDLRRQQNESDRTFVRLPRRELRVGSTTDAPMQPSGTADGL